MEVSEYGGTPRSSKLDHFSIETHFGGSSTLKKPKKISVNPKIGEKTYL